MVARQAHRLSDPPFPVLSATGPHELGLGRLVLGTPNGRPQKVLRIDATDIPSSLLGRLLVGSYVTGQDQVLVTARGGLTPGQRKEVRRVVDRLLGMSVVGDAPELVEIQNFVDPSKYELPRLLHRVVGLIRDELAICRAALAELRIEGLTRIDLLEEEIDQHYLLMVRQLLLSSDSPRLAREIDVPSHHFQLGDRLVAKVLEVTGDLIHAIGSDLLENLAGGRSLPRGLRRALDSRLGLLEDLLARSMAAFTTLSVLEANAALDCLGPLLLRDGELGLRIGQEVADRKVAAAAERIDCNLRMVLEMLVIVNEVTINRGVEPETVAKTALKVTMNPRDRGEPSP